MGRLLGAAVAVPLLVALGGCGGVQSALAPASPDAERVATLWWWMAGGALLVWTAVVGLAVYAIRVRPGAHDERKANLLIIGGGAVFPTLVLAALLLYGLPLTPELLAPGEEGLEIHVSGEEWWWRVEYRTADGDTVELANEVRLPVDVRTEITLSSPDVIHSFWVPSLGGKVDMIPGRETRTALEPSRTGTFRGVCAEYCGRAHARMAFVAVVMERNAFDEWLAAQRRPAGGRPRGGPAASPDSSRGKELFLTHGCGACHTVRGTPADGAVGPDLTHVASRKTVGAGTLPMSEESLARWIAEAPEIKPGVHMPGFDMLPEGDVRAMAAWLAELR